MSAAGLASTQEPTDAKARLLVAAEKNIALFGVDAVPIRKILEDAGQRNSSAIHYHFGSRENLISAILDARIGEVDGDRTAYLERMSTKYPDEIPLRDLIQILVRPLADFVIRSHGNSHYVRFLIHLLHHKDYHAMVFYASPMVHRRALAGMQVVEAIRRALILLPAALVEARIGATNEHMLASLAFLEATAKGLSPFEWDWRISNLIDMLVEGLTSPPSASTVELLAGPS